MFVQVIGIRRIKGPPRPPGVRPGGAGGVWVWGSGRGESAALSFGGGGRLAACFSSGGGPPGGTSTTGVFFKKTPERIGGFAVLVFSSSILQAACAQAVPQATGDARVDTLLSQMTLEEKLTLIHDGREDPATYQGQAGYIGGVPRLGIPGLRMADGPPGVLTRHPSQALTATMGVAATFNVGIARQNGVVIGREARALGIDVALQPYINIDRDLTFKRAYNTFGEDPLLTSRIGAAEIEGIQSQQCHGHGQALHRL